jgi:hypothetical protein
LGDLSAEHGENLTVDDECLRRPTVRDSLWLFDSF